MKRRWHLGWLGGLLLCQSCATSALWEATDPTRPTWVDESCITEDELQRQGRDYQRWDIGEDQGYLVDKSTWQKAVDIHLRVVGLPVTLGMDAVGTVTGLLLLDNWFWYSLLELAVESSIR